ncbi:1-phosphofructokinase family hexose kinase [Hymenobacter sp. BT770]|uniref:1-phosphofructokinase family hexose kinase n=1 Tax=Hymenobacter sp. BT770 TaxID=2886942 RepID=UPI001D0FD203|nr:1-phosphofructokinase family hexose kinase [Hymenobacter sp. BT770]MCC3153134.1 1-phosphofructokinase family hexose kinase [Hymenobacter sp. BT770]MDO3415392.1 1-phosphofructokinase family hexose kinase [Hymenobacter sp. BT770]
MKHVVTLTLSPAIDKSTSVPQLVPEQKLRCEQPKVEPGGGGINVARALKRLGLDSQAVFVAGGPPGEVLKQLVAREGIEQHPVPTEAWTRENFTVVDASNNQQYRFGMPGTELIASEQAQVLATLAGLSPVPDVLVASGSLPPGVAPEFMGEIARWASSVGAKLIVDTSGEALRCAVHEGVFLLKPNLGELAMLAGTDALDSESAAAAARSIVEAGKCEIVVVSLGAAGACFVTREVEEHIAAPAVRKRSTVGAGDSMVAGMVYALCQGRPVREAVRMGVACGSAATMNSGTELFHARDAARLYEWLLQTMPRLVPVH